MRIMFCLGVLGLVTVVAGVGVAAESSLEGQLATCRAAMEAGKYKEAADTAAGILRGVKDDAAARRTVA